MEYIIITLMAIAATTCLVYLLANKVFAVRLRLKSLILCAACALFLSLILPRIVVSFAGLAGTVGFLAVFAVIFAYFVAYYDEPGDLQPAGHGPQAMPPMSPPDTVQDTVQLPANFSSTIAEEHQHPIVVLPLDNPEPTALLHEEPVYAAAAIAAEDLGAELAERPASFAVIAETPERFEDATEDIQPAPASEDTTLLMVLDADNIADAEPAIQQPEAESTATIETTPDVESVEPSPLTEPEALEPESETADELVQTAETAPNSAQEAISDPEVVVVETSHSDILDMEIELNLIAGPVAEPVSELEYEAEGELTVPSHFATTIVSQPDLRPDEASHTPDIEPDILATTDNEPLDIDVSPLPTNFAAPDDLQPEEVGDTTATAAAEEQTEEHEVTLLPEPSSDSLDDLLDFAFTQKDRGNYPLALDTFRRAFKFYRQSEAGPLLAIEIAGLLKAKGSYDEAVTLLSESRNLPALLQNATLDQEFINTIAYLRIVKNTLLQNRIGLVPFPRIPADVAAEIDAEFREWRNLA